MKTTGMVIMLMGVALAVSADAEVMAARGIRRLTDVAAIPVVDAGAQICYEGSIDRSGGNADWDWGMYQDDNGEWVLAEDDGAGCIFNFTQHRFSEAPVTFRFYFNEEKSPRVTLTPSDFGEVAPFVEPLAGKFVPDKAASKGRSFAIVRSFVPMEYTNGFKVTSSVSLRNRNPGGWGHVLYHRYADARGIGTFRPEAFNKEIGRQARRLCLASDGRKAMPRTAVPPGQSVIVSAGGGQGVLSEILLTVESFRTGDLTNVWMVLTFDGERTCEAPIGTFFGCESSAVKANIETALLSIDLRAEDARFSNRFPMPYFKSFNVSLENRGLKALTCSAEVYESHTVKYEASRTGLFMSTKYLLPTKCVDGRNTLIGEAHGCGHIAYAVLSGYGIKYGCEGDVRLYIDRFAAPAVQSDGTESFGSWGWGFCAPPQAHAFSAYSGIHDGAKHPFNHIEWSLLRLMHLDNCPFRHAFRFELEHGRDNHGGGSHSGQVFYYAIRK